MSQNSVAGSNHHSHVVSNVINEKAFVGINNTGNNTSDSGNN